MSTVGLTGPMFPGPYRVPAAGFMCRTVYSNTAPRTPYRGPVAVRDPRTRDRLRRRRPADGDRPGGAAAPQPPQPRRHALRQPVRDGVRRHLAPRDLREGARDPRLRGLPARAGRGARARAVTSAWASATTSSRPSPGMGSMGTEGATIRIEPSGEMNVYIAGGSSGNSVETTVVQLAADALGMDIADVRTIQGDTALTGLRRGYRWEPYRLDDRRRHQRDRVRCCASGSRRSRPTSSRRRSTTSSSPTVARASAAHRRSA